MRLIGLMSGTSVDGIDAALVEVEGTPGRLQWRLVGFVCVPWEADLRRVIVEACRPDAPLQTVTALNVLIGEAFASAASAVAAASGVGLDTVDAIASHGQTVWHQPVPFSLAGVGVTGTLQIGEPAVIAARTGCLVVADFRVADMAMGGQGAPLVPFADYALFQSSTETRVVQNIGGIANLTFLPQGGSLEDVRAFDTGPGNMLMDAVVRQRTNDTLQMDREGALAGNGSPNSDLLEWCLSHPFLHKRPPKSTGREDFGTAYAGELIRKASLLRLTMEDTLATANALTAESIARAYEAWLTPLAAIDVVIVGGGGVHNATLMRRLADRLSPARLTTHAEFGLPDDAKEAVAFALLAHETLHNRPSNIPSATGARGPAVLGKLVLPAQGWNRRGFVLDKLA